MEQRNSIIKTEVILQQTPDIFYKDELIFVRDEQIRELYQMLSPGTPIKPPIKNVTYFGDVIKYIWGWKGTGKTTMLKWFQHKVSSMEVKVIYINCRLNPTPVGLSNDVLKHLQGLYPDFVSKEESRRAIIADYVKQIKNKQVFLLLDEIDKPLRNSSTPQKDEFIHFLIRLVAENTHNLFKVVFSTNIVNIERFLSDEVLSFLGGQKIFFGVYSVEEMVQILDKRAKEAFYNNTYTQEDLFKIAHTTHNKYDGDIRTALRLLRDVARGSESKLDVSLLSKMEKEMDFDLLKKEVLTFPKGVQILLASLIDNILKTGKPELGYKHFQTDEIYYIYESFCKREAYPTSKRAMYYRYLGILIDSMILIKQTEGYKFSENIKDLEKCLNLVV